MAQAPLAETAGQIDSHHLFEKCMAGKKRGRIAAGDAREFVRSPFALWCKWHAPKDQRDPHSQFMHLLFDAGSAHEQTYVVETFPEAERIADKPRPEGFLRALQAMARGAAVLHGVPLYYLVEDLYGTADLLERDDNRPSVFGPFHYWVLEVKIAKESGRIIGSRPRSTPAFSG